MQIPIFSQDGEQFIWSDEIAKFTIFPAFDFQGWVVRAYSDESHFLSMGYFNTTEEAREFMLCSMLEMVETA